MALLPRASEDITSLKFLSDENISRKTTKLFRDAGYDIETVQSLGLQGTHNSILINLSIQHNRVLITFDTDFEVVNKIVFPGIILIQINPNTDLNVLPAIQKFLSELSNLTLRNRIIFIDEHGNKNII